MGVVVSRSTLPESYTVVCSDCGVSLGFDISDHEYAVDQDKWDEWRCPTCKKGAPKQRKIVGAAVKWSPNNIFSGSPYGLAVLTNMTELAHKKGTLKNHYPVHTSGRTYPDAEAAYQDIKKRSEHLTLDERERLMAQIIADKLRQYPLLVDSISISGGVHFLNGCWHRTSANNADWEGNGPKSRFIRALTSAYRRVLQERNE